MANTYLSLYASGFLSPNAIGQTYDVGHNFKLNAEGRLKKYPEKDVAGNTIRKIGYIPTDEDLINVIKSCKNLKRVDIYSHAYGYGINLGGFLGKKKYRRKTGEKEVRTNSSWDLGGWLDWDDTVKKVPVYGDVEIDSKNVDWRANKSDWRCFETDEISLISKSSFLPSCEIFFWGCNAGGHDDYDEKTSIANLMAKHIGCTVYAYKGGGGAMFITKSDGKTVVPNGNMITANIWFNNKGKDLTSIDPMKYLTKFPK